MTDRDQTRHRPIAIWGAYGGMNIGDEAILVAMVDLLRSRDLDPKALIVQKEPELAVANSYRSLGLDPIAFRSLPRIIRALRSSDLICGGGQMLDDKGRLGWPVGYTAVLVLLNRLLGGRPILFGIGGEPVSRGITRWLVRRFYRLAHFGMVRDRPSQDALVDAGYPEARTVVGGDVALTLSSLPQAEDDSDRRRLLVIPNRDAQRVGSLSDVFSRTIRAAADADWSITVMAHDRRPEYDGGELDRLRAELEIAEIEYVVPACLDEGLMQYRQADVVVSARMHPLLLAILQGVAPVAIPAVDKVKTLVSDLSLPIIAVDSPATKIPGILGAAVNQPQDEIQRKIETRRTAVNECLDAAAAMWRSPHRPSKSGLVLSR